MSDSPHRSLLMRPGWKKVAEYAGNKTSRATKCAMPSRQRSKRIGARMFPGHWFQAFARSSVEPRMFLAQPVPGSAFERCEEEAGASAGPEQKRMGGFYGFAWTGFVRSKMD